MPGSPGSTHETHGIDISPQRWDEGVESLAKLECAGRAARSSCCSTAHSSRFSWSAERSVSAEAGPCAARTQKAIAGEADGDAVAGSGRRWEIDHGEAGARVGGHGGEEAPGVAHDDRPHVVVAGAGAQAPRGAH